MNGHLHNLVVEGCNFPVQPPRRCRMGTEVLRLFPMATREYEATAAAFPSDRPRNGLFERIKFARLLAIQ
jgi:hypothetical protein